MKIGYVLKRFPRASETFIAQEILGLERQGIEVVVFALRPNDQFAEHAWLGEVIAPVHVFEPRGFSSCWRALQTRARKEPWRRPSVHEALLAAFDHPKRSGKRYLSESWWIAEMTEDLGVQHLHAHFANHPTFVAMLSHLISGVSFSFTAHAKDIYLDSPSIEVWRDQMERSAFAVTVSHANRTYLESLLGSETTGNLHMVHNGVDLDRIKPVEAQRSGAGRKVVFASRLIEKKGADNLIDAARQVLQSDSDVEFSIIGEGEEDAKLKDQAARSGILDRLRFSGALPHQEVVQRIGEADIFVLPCRVAADGDRDALPTVLLEAMAAGVPCISTPVNGVPETIDQGRTGLIVPENDPASLAAAIHHLLVDPEGRRAMGRAGRRSAERKFDLRSSSGRLRLLFESAIAGRTMDLERPESTVSAVRGV